MLGEVEVAWRVFESCGRTNASELVITQPTKATSERHEHATDTICVSHENSSNNTSDGRECNRRATKSMNDQTQSSSFEKRDHDHGNDGRATNDKIRSHLVDLFQGQ